MTLWEDTLAHQIKILAEENEKLRATIEKVKILAEENEKLKATIEKVKILAEENEKLKARIEKALDVLGSPATDWSEKGDEILVDIERILEGNDEKEEVIKE
jgi:prefoldin subunit 5